MAARPELTRMTVNLAPRPKASLDRVCKKTGDSMTDALNKAAMMYEMILNIVDEGDGQTLRVQLPNGEIRIIQFLG